MGSGFVKHFISIYFGYSDTVGREFSLDVDWVEYCAEWEK